MVAFVNKVELAPHVGVDIELMREDTAAARDGRPFVFGSMRKDDGVLELADFVLLEGGVNA